MSHYKIVEDETIAGLVNKVNSNIKAGFEPIGGASSRVFDPSSTGYFFIQAVIFRGKTK